MAGAPDEGTCPAHAHLAKDGICDCDEGFPLNAAGDACETPCEGTAVSGDAGAVLVTAPQVVQVSGLTCHTAANTAEFTLQGQLVNGRPYWSAAGGYSIYWGKLQGAEPAWLLDSQGTIDACLLEAENPTVVAVVQSDDRFPPRDGEWRDRCAGPWRFSSMSISYVPSAANCAALASACLASPTCAGSIHTGCPSAIMRCSVPCADLWLHEMERCSAYTRDFDSSPLTSACQQRAHAALATAPSSVALSASVSGGNCYAFAYTVYSRQAVPINGKPHYRTADGVWHLYWAEDQGVFGVAGWSVDRDQDAGFAELFLNSGADSPPFGTSKWTQTCNDETTSLPLVITPQFSKTWCADALVALAPELTTVCCMASNDASCGVGGIVPTTCSVDCASLWSPYADRCDVSANDIGAGLADFFNIDCVPAVAALAVLAPTTVTLEESETAEWSFPVVSGIRYEVTVSSGLGDGTTRTCTLNEYDDPTFSRGSSGAGECDRHISSGMWSCNGDLGQTGPVISTTTHAGRHYCDLSCGFQCVQNGVDETSIWVSPQGAAQAVASSLQTSSDKAIGFTATSTGDFTARVRASAGAGPVTIQANAIGSAELRAPQLLADGLAYPVTVRCHLDDCAFGYSDASVFDGDGHGFDLRMRAQAGVAYAVTINLPGGQTAAEVTATFFYAGAAAGSAGFSPTLRGSMGNWTATSANSHAYTEYMTCQADDPTCEYVTIGVHPGQEYGSHMQGVWVAPSSGDVLMHLSLSCDVPFFADVELPGCAMRNGVGGCQRTDSGHDYGRCSSQLSLSVTEGAFFEPPAADTDERDAQARAMLHVGQATVTTVLLIDSSELQAQATAMFQATPEIHRVNPNPPTVDEMLVPGSEGSAILGSMFISQQQPHVIYPTSFAAGSATGGDNSGHRRAQMTAEDLHVQVQMQAPTPEEAQRALDRIAQSVGGYRQGQATVPGKGRRRAQAVGGDCPGAAVAPPPAPPPPLLPTALAATVVPALEPVFAAPVCTLGSLAPECTAQGQTVQSGTIIVRREELEAQASSMFQATPEVHRINPNPPTMDEMLVGGTEGQAILSSMFVQQAQPHQVFPISYQEVSAQEHSMLTGANQHAGGGSFVAVTVVAQAPTPEGSRAAAEELHAQAGAMFPTAVRLRPADLAQQGR